MNKNVLRILTLPERLRNLILFLIFRFDRWHISPSKNRVYPRDIINYVNNLTNIFNVCEIGCGLGDTISQINAKKRIGFDKDNNVLKAASWLHSGKTNLKFDFFSFPDSNLIGNFDIIIVVNWIHSFDNKIIKAKFIEYFTNNLSINGMLIVDSVNNPNYRYYHDFTNYFAHLNCVVREIGEYQSGRKIILIQKVNN